jgi:hypothetical protein
MAAATPASAPGDEARMIYIPNKEGCGTELLLEMAAEAKFLVTRNEQFLVYTAVGVVTNRASFSDRLVFEDKWPALGGMAFETGFIGGGRRRRTALDHPAFVRIVAVAATDFPLLHRVVIGEVELPAHLQMALQAGFGILPRIYDRVGSAAGLIVETAGSVAGLTTHFFGIVPLRH